MCEVENEFVMGLLADAVRAALPGRDCRVVHADTVDQRGIDVAFIYDADLFTVSSAAYRAVAGETLAYFHQRALEVHGPETPVLVMGDFNDEPSDLSLTQHALSTRQRSKVLGAIKAPLLWNLMGPVIGADDGRDAEGVPVPAGTFYFQNFANVLDQFLVGKNMIGAYARLRAEPASVAILTRPAAMIGTGTYPAPVPFGGMGKDVNSDGYSDHYPFIMRVEHKE